MKLVKTSIAALGVVAMLAVPATSMAAPPEPPTSWGAVSKDNTTYEQSNLVGQYSSRIEHNGWFVSGHKNSMNIDNTTDPGSRADSVQGLLGH